MKREQDSQQGNEKDGEQDMEPDRERDKEHEQNKEQHKEQDSEQYKQQEKQEGTEQDSEENKRDRRTDKKQDGEGDEEADEQRYHQQQQQQIEDEDEGQKERTGNDERETVADGDVKRSAAESLISRLPAARLWHRQYDSDQQTIVSTLRTQFLTSHFGCTAHCPTQQVLAIDVRSRSIQTDASQIRPLQSRELFNYCIVYRLIV